MQHCGGSRKNEVRENQLSRERWHVIRKMANTALAGLGESKRDVGTQTDTELPQDTTARSQVTVRVIVCENSQPTVTVKAAESSDDDELYTPSPRLRMTTV